MAWFRRRRDTVACREAVALMTAYLDDVLDRRDRARLEAHLSACPHCEEYLAQIRLTIAALGRADPEALGSAALDDLVEVYRRWRAG